MKITPESFILQLSGEERSRVQQYLSKNVAAWKVLNSATNVDGETLECVCTVKEFQSILKALRMKRGTGRIVWKLILQKLKASTKAKKTRDVVD
jgi:hypothetical protein